MTGGIRRTAAAAAVTALMGLGSVPPPPAAVLGIDVLAYDVELSLEHSESFFQGRVSIRLALQDPRPEELPLDLSGLEVESVRIDGTDTPFRRNGGTLSVAIPPSAEVGEELVVEVLYGGSPIDGLILRNNARGVRSAFVDNWPDRARLWLPSIDHPSDKATVGFTVHAPSAWSVVANGRMVGTPSPTDSEALGGAGDRRTWRWETGVPVSTYNMVIGASEFAIRSVGTAACGRAPATVRDDGCVDVSYWVYPADTSFAEELFARAPEMVDFFAELIGPFPFEKLANVQSATRFGGMENASAIFYSEEAIARGTMAEGTVSHEIAHQWFGDSVTEAEWSNLWLSEGFATYFGALFFEYADGSDEFRRRMEESRRTYVSSDDVGQPIVRAENNLMDLLNRNNYQKGAWVLHMLRSVLGDEDFFAGIREYFGRHAGDVILTADFQRAMEDVSGQDLEWFFRQWVYEPGYPRLAISTAWIPGTGELEIRIRQEQPQSWPTFRFAADVEFELPGRLLRASVDVRDRDQTVRITLPQGPTGITFDPDGWILKEIIGDG
ncbi:MAG: M1 family metallopeptidase [Gemmatimonadota bacterium]|nr:MAG: M1 family metallopeptidase [Gemmatimonadota bacterium]